MGTRPPICLQLNCTATASSAALRSSATFTVTLVLPPGSSGESYSDGQGTYLNYGCDSIKPGQWLAGASAGYAWRIIQIVNDALDANGDVMPNSFNQVTLLVEDVNNFNVQILSMELHRLHLIQQRHRIIFISNSIVMVCLYLHLPLDYYPVDFCII